MNSQSVTSLIDHWATETPNHPFVRGVNGESEVTYAALQSRARAVANYLSDLGLSPGDSVAYAFDNCPDNAVFLLGIFYGGFRAVAINLVAGPQIMGYVLAHSDTRVVFTEAHHSELLVSALTHWRTESKQSYTQSDTGVTAPEVIVFDEALTDSLQHPAATAKFSATSDAVAQGSDALLMYTSGTTGRPKGVVLSHANLVAGGQNTATAHELKAADRALCVLPLYHINGLCVTVMAPLVSGGSVVIPPKFSSSRFWAWCLDHQCTWFSVVPTQVSYLLHGDDVLPQGHSLRFGRSASAPLSPEVHRAFEDRFGLPLIETMGLTETSAQILSNPLPPGERRVGSPGIAFGDEVIICDSNGTEQAADTEGELWVRGPNVMQRYYKNTEATEAALTGDGWLRTGDLGRRDANGYIFITGRLKELIIKGGENIAPREIDEALYQHPDVIEAAAFALPCERYGQRIEAAVAVREGSPVKESDLLSLCESVLGLFKRPDKIYFMDMLPKGPSGKIQRIKLPKLTNP